MRVRACLTQRDCLQRLVGMAALFGVITAPGCSDPLESGWKDRDIVVDGRYGEWDGAILSFEGERLGIGLMNDDRDLYLSVYLGDRRRQIQALTGGCTVWFDGAEKGERSFGIRAPLGLTPDAVTELTRGLRLGVDMDSLIHTLGVRTDQFAVVDAEGGMRTMSSGGPIDLALGSSGGYLVLEMRVPLRKEVEGPPAIHAAAGGRFRLGIEMASMPGPGADGHGLPGGSGRELGSEEGRPSGRHPGGGGGEGDRGGGPRGSGGPGGGGPGGPAGGRNGMGGGRGRPSNDALMTWIDVVLGAPATDR